MFAVFTAFAIFAALAVAGISGLLLRVRLGLCLRLRRGGALLRFVRSTLFDDLVEFAAVEPDAAAFWAIVDLDVLALGHHQVDLAGGAQKSGGGELSHQNPSCDATFRRVGCCRARHGIGGVMVIL